jgi:hypothetical protein
MVAGWLTPAWSPPGRKFDSPAWAPYFSGMPPRRRATKDTPAKRSSILRLIASNDPMNEIDRGTLSLTARADRRKSRDAAEG